ncbi:MAG TPA: hypothetical protein VFS39_04915 [Nitrospira sp.]|nr:hypothetical protein [Nitrospira sp.]
MKRPLLGRWCIALLLGSWALSGCSNSSSNNSPNGGSNSGGVVAASPGTLTYRNDNARTGQNLEETILTPANVNAAQFGLLFSYPVDGWVYAQPLYMPNVFIGGQPRNVVFVATEHDTVYAFDADGGGILWQRSFIDPGSGVTSVPMGDIGCTEVLTENGITSTPVIDPASGILYVVAMTKENGEYVYRIHALSITTGNDVIGTGTVIAPSIPGAADPNDGQGHVVFNPIRHKQRAALLLTNGLVYVAFASQCDVPPYHGWLLGYDVKTLQLVATFNDTPNGDDGGIWNGGPAADAAGNVFVITGNGTFDRQNNMSNTNWGDSFLRMTARLGVIDFFTPFNQQVLADNDLDLGSSIPMLLPDQSVGRPHLLISGGKEGRIYVVDRDNMGGFQTTDDSQIVQELDPFPGALFTGPAYFNNTVYFAANHDVVKAFSLTNGLLSASPVAQGSAPFTYPGSQLTISANGSINGIVWALDVGIPVILRAYLAADVGQLLYDSGNALQNFGGGQSFMVPTVANGKVYVITGDTLSVFGLLH